MPEMAWVWLAALVIFAIVEASTVTLVSIWFVGGSLAALIAALCGGELWLQVVLFLAVSILLLLSLRPLLRKFYSPKKIQTNAPANIGKLAIVTEDIDNLRSTGAVKLSGVVWTARSNSGAVIPIGTVVRITGLEGVKLFVEPAEVEANV
ncbi:MAG: NfeD family protein [Oscillospiraceae bacterium]|nr:NfeD family protein [Oscillospiraceae bacterium]